MKHNEKITPVSPELFSYIEAHSTLCHPILDTISLETAKLPDAVMQIPRHQGSFMYLLALSMNVANALEIGCYTGYSAICLASALPSHGRLTTIDNDAKTSQKAKMYFTSAQLGSVIELIEEDATKALRHLLYEKQRKHFYDLAFIDADKVNYETYYELCLDLVRPGGVLLIDNSFRDGEVLAPAVKDLGTQAVRRLSDAIITDNRVDGALLPIADGVFMVRKKSI